MDIGVKSLLSLCLIGVCCLALYFYKIIWSVPERIRKQLRRQGIDGPPPSFPYGNLLDMKRLVVAAAAKGGGRRRRRRRRRGGGGEEAIQHDYRSSVFPHYEQWRNEYGPVFSYRMGNIVMLHVSQPEVVRDISLCVSLDLGKGSYLKKTHEPLFGQGILKSNGETWAHQRKIIAPEFFLDKVKGMMDLMIDCTYPLLKAWEDKVEQNGGMVEMKIDDDLRTYSADIISRACFGSSYVKGKEIFMKLRALQRVVSKPNMFAEITGFRYLPTKRNREAWRLNREIHSLILKIVRESERGGEKNLLHAILRNASGDEMGKADRFVVDNCKSIYFAGHETTAVTATWSLMLLGLHPEWQARVREEVVDLTAGGRPPDARSLHKMKALTMVIQETLRLYPPGAFVSRETLQEMKFGGIHIPKGVNVYVPVSTLHHDPKIWGEDVDEFNPARFANGVIGACQLPHMYLPFGAGTRTCLGQNFAMVELKIVLSLILSKFQFTLSPKYHHSPALRLIVEPEFGVDLIMKKVEPKFDQQMEKKTS